jgi:glucose-6-phosphate 1-dehydrogenase
MVSRPIELHLDQDGIRGRGPYERLISDALRGDPALFARQDGVMEAWRIFEPVLAEHAPASRYDRGTWGPAEADRLLGEDWVWITR